MKRVERYTTAWVIVWVEEPPVIPAPAVIGVFNFEHGPLEPWRDGMRWSLFRTREQARRHGKQLGLPIRIAKVGIHLKELQ